MRARCYTAADVRQLLNMPKSTFNDFRRRGRLPFLEEIKPRIGRTARYRADLVDDYLSNRWRDHIRQVR